MNFKTSFPVKVNEYLNKLQLNQSVGILERNCKTNTSPPHSPLETCEIDVQFSCDFSLVKALNAVHHVGDIEVAFEAREEE